MVKMSKFFIVLFVFHFFGLMVFPSDTRITDFKQLKLDKDMASKFASMAMRCIEKEYPNKLSHVMNNEREVLNPKALHPAFYGCFDWHSSVHGHWMLIRLLKRFPQLPEAGKIRSALNRNLSRDNIKREVEYMKQPSRKSFERMYGWAWLLKLVEELYNWDDQDGRLWLKNLLPLEKEIVNRYLIFLPKQTYPIRTGVHPNTAFGLAFALDYARTSKNVKLENMIIKRSYDYFSKDSNCPAKWEPGGEDFFPPCLMEADLMRRVMKPKEFARWFHQFLPRLRKKKPRMLLEPAIVTDRSDGKLVHLDGLNLSRAWCMVSVSMTLPENDRVREVLMDSAIKHATDALKNIHSGEYSGEHWLASFAIYLLTQK